MMRIALALAATTLLGGQARAVEAVFNSTPELVRACRVASSGQRPHDEIGVLDYITDMTACSSYLWGYVAGARRSEERICFPNGGMTGNQLEAVFLQWANANPQSWDQRPEDTVFTAFAKAWPCQVTGATK